MKSAANLVVVGIGLVLLLLGAHPAWAETPRTITNSIGMKLVLVPAGEFTMGAEEDRGETIKYFPYVDPKELKGELPRHKVRITKPFYLGQYEVTLGQFMKFHRDAKYKTEIERFDAGFGENEEGRFTFSTDFRPWTPGWKIEMNHPVVYVSWNDADAFCKWLSKQEGKTYRLPTEAEWEYACRAGSEHRYHFGDDPEELIRYGNVADQDRKLIAKDSTIPLYKDGKETDTKIPFPFASGRDGYKWTAPVGKFQPNIFELYDMHGNVWEWCSDWYDEHYNAQSPPNDPQGPAAGRGRVLRGGGFADILVRLRCAHRGGSFPEFSFNCIGFRVVCEE